jgi:hypothetical protein
LLEVGRKEGGVRWREEEGFLGRVFPLYLQKIELVTCKCIEVRGVEVGSGCVPWKDPVES